MPNLGDYIGHLLSEITIARMHADIETVRVAELYAGHPLLRHMPVPHFRLPNVEVDVPVVIKQMEEPRSGELPRGAPALKNMRKAFDEVLTKRLSEERIRLKPEHKKKLKSVLDKKMVSLTQPIEMAIDVNRVADELASTVSRTLTESGGPVDPARRPKLEEKLKEEARIEFLKLRKPPTRLQALVTTAEIREAGPSEVITRLQLKITEEAVEWTTIESNGRKQDRLIPE
jgi:hypothetical protein